MAGSFVGVAILFAIPVGILGMSSPFAIRLVSEDKEHAGRAAGSIYALSTAGSILGTFLPGFVLIPHLGTQTTILSFGGLMLLVGATGRGSATLTATAVAGVLGAGWVLGPLKHMDRYVHTRESAYNFIQVVEKKMTRDGRSRRYLVLNEGRAVHSIYDPDETYAPLVGGVWDYMNAAPVLAYSGKPMKTAVIGLAAGTVPNEWLGLFREPWGLEVDGAEIDPGILAVGREYFSLAQDEKRGLTAHAQDGRLFLRRQAPESYDVILTDAYKQPYIPFHLATKEYFQLVHDRLKDGGVMAINVGALDVKAEIFVRLLSTISSVFGEVRYILVRNPGVPFNNHVVMAVKGDAQWERLNPDRNPAFLDVQARTNNLALFHTFRRGWESLHTFRDYDPSKVFTDDLAPVEFFTEKMILDYLAAGGAVIQA
jgi:spermidine synthase